jgi:tetratricopeptide (TPR) repeat protein
MLPQNSPQNDSKLLLAVAGVVVAGAVAVALVAGLTVEGDRESASVADERQMSRQSDAGARTIARKPVQPQIELASLESGTVESDLATVIEPEPPAFEIDPDVDPWREGSRAYHERDYVRAAAYFGADAEARPDRAYTHYMLGLASWKSGDLDRALEAMERSVSINDGSIRSFINLSRIRNARGEHEDARAAAEQALAIDPENTTALYQLARSEYNLGKIDEATTTLEACIGLDQAAAEAHNLLGLVRLQRGENADALVSFETAAELKPDVAYIQNNLGMAFEQSGRLEDAAIALRRAIEIDAGHQAASVSLARIEQRLPIETGEPTTAIELADAGQAPTVVAAVEGTAPPAIDEPNEERNSIDAGDRESGGGSSD